MGFEVSYVIAPLLGGVIGYITNDLAIGMLFRPHKAKYIFGIHIPFTPGIIPKEKSRIAEALGKVISENLMNQEVLERYLLSDEMVGKIRSVVGNFIETQKSNDETVKEFLLHYLSEGEIDSIIGNANVSISSQLYVKLSDPSVGETIARVAVVYISERLNGTNVDELLPDSSEATGIASRLFKKSLSAILDMVKEPIEGFLARNINNILKDNGKVILSNMIDGEVDLFLDKPVSQLLDGHELQLSQAVNTVESLYCKVIKEHLPRILESVDIGKIVRERINEMDVAETEKLILMVMNKELRAIVWLGALLGLVMGSINILI